MSSLVSFDHKGAFGPAMSLIYNSQYYNEKAVLELSKLLKENFIKLSNVKPKHKKEFCEFIRKKNQSQMLITPAEVIATKFFQSMQKPGISSDYHQKVLKFIVPSMLKAIPEQIPQTSGETGETKQVNEWLAGLVESIMTEDQIKKHCEFQSAVSEKVIEERQNIGKELYKAATNKTLTEKDFNFLIEVNQYALKHLKNADHFASTLNFTGKYLILFSMNEENPEVLATDVLSLLSTVFREKMFKKTM